MDEKTMAQTKGGQTMADNSDLLQPKKAATFEEGQGTVATWMGSEPTICQITGTKIDMVFIDGRTKMGPWAIMCPAAHKEVGVGLGLGRGQRYMKYGDRWVKVDG